MMQRSPDEKIIKKPSKRQGTARYDHTYNLHILGTSYPITIDGSSIMIDDLFIMARYIETSRVRQGFKDFRGFIDGDSELYSEYDIDGFERDVLTAVCKKRGMTHEQRRAAGAYYESKLDSQYDFMDGQIEVFRMIDNSGYELFFTNGSDYSPWRSHFISQYSKVDKEQILSILGTTLIKKREKKKRGS